MPGTRQDIAEVLVLRIRGLPYEAVVYHLGKANDGVERGSQLVGHVGQELALEPVDLLDAAVLLHQFLVFSDHVFHLLAISDIAGNAGSPDTGPTAVPDE